MKRKCALTAFSGILCFSLVSFALVNQTIADGTEQLDIPSIPIAQGSQMTVAGTGLYDLLPGETSDISVEIDAGASIKQVLLYWTGRTWYYDPDPGDEDTITVDTIEIKGERIGGPTPPPTRAPCSTYRADITQVNSIAAWILAGQTSVLPVGGLDFTQHNDGAAVVVIWDDGSTSDIQIKDGNDYAYSRTGYQTEPVNFPIAPSASPRLAELSLIVSDIDVPRPAAADITVNGITTRLDDVFLNNEGNFLDVVELEIPVSPGATNITVQLWSVEVVGKQPASLAWSFAGLELAVPGDHGCTYTQGYWKNHPKDWPTDTLSLFSARKALRILKTPPKKGNAYYILAHQYIAAELNVVNGASIPDEAFEAWIAGQELLEQYQQKKYIPKKTDDRDEAIAIAKILDAYNNGKIGPGHCD
ncbi:hypothetical protein P4B35_13690 [Pontiellaceae bacterium B12227]|nr:hypothetical protein [Pontiellaceae bacterium B12227]